MGRGKARPAGNGLDHGNVVRLGERRKLGCGAGIADSPAGDDQRPLRRLQRGDGTLPVGRGRLVARDVMDRRGEELVGEVEGLGLHILREGQHSRAAVGRVEHDGDRVRQRVDDLLGAHDAIPVAADRL